MVWNPDRFRMLGRRIPTLPPGIGGRAGKSNEYGLHFVTMREMVNIALAACDGHEGNPGEYRDYRFRLAHAHVRI